MASIVENIIGDKALQMGSEEFVRKMRIGNNWNYLRIGVRIVVNGTATISAARFQLGLCNGDQETWASNNCAGYIGVAPGFVTSGGHAYTYNAAGYFTYSGSGQNTSNRITKLGSTVTDAAGGTATTGYIAASSGSTDYRPSMLIADFLRVSASSYNLVVHHTSLVELAFAPISQYDLLRCIEDENISSAFASSRITKDADSVVSGMPSNFDTLSLYWNKATPTIELSDVFAIRFY